MCIVACQPEKEVVWDNPSSIQSVYGNRYHVTKVELRESETVLHLELNSYGRMWYKFTNEAVLRTDDGQEYGLLSCAKTSDEESDLQIDSLYWTPINGRTKLALHFQPLPLDTRRMHMIKGRKWGDTKIMNICDATTFDAPEWPSDWQGIQYDPNETLSPTKIKKGVATIRVKMLDYHPDLGWGVNVSNFKPLGSDDYFRRSCYFDDDGCAKIEVPLDFPREATVRIDGIMDHFIVIAPGEETSILVRAAADSSGLLAFKGYMAKTNMDLFHADNNYSDFYLKYGIMDSLDNCFTTEERIHCLTSLLDKRIHDIQSSDYTPAAKELLCMSAEKQYMNWFYGFGANYIRHLEMHDKVKFDSNLRGKMWAHRDEYLPYGTPDPYALQYLNRNTAPTSHCFDWMSDRLVEQTDRTMCPLNHDIWDAQRLVYRHQVTPQNIAKIQDKECRAILQNYLAEKQDLSDKIKQHPRLHYKDYVNVPAKDMYKVLFDKYKGKPIAVLMWNCYSYASSEYLRELSSMEERLKKQNVPFITISTDHSSPDIWYNTVKDIPGEHYFLTSVQFNYMLKRYETEGVPTCVIYDKQGNRAYTSVGQYDISGMERVLQWLKDQSNS